jgi:alpha-glucosidase
MLTRGLRYLILSAARQVREQHPALSGLALWLEVMKTMPRSSQDKHTLPGRTTPVGALLEHTAGTSHITLRHTHGSTLITALADDLCLIRARSDSDFPPYQSYSISKPEADWSGSQSFSIHESPESIRITLPAFSLEVARASGQMALFTPSGARILSQVQAGYASGTQGLQWQADFPDQAAIYGLGEKASALNHNGRRLILWNSDPAVYDRGHEPIYMSVPFLLMLSEGEAIGLYIDNTHYAALDLGADQAGRLDYRAVGGELRLFLMAGTPASVIERYTELTGRPALPPLWALGFHQSRWSYYPQARVLEIAEQFRQRRLPCDAIHLDIHYMDGYRCFTWDHTRFPDPPALLNTLHAQGFKAVSIIDPGIKIDPAYHVYQSGMQRSAFLKHPDGTPYTGPVWPGDCHFPDFTDPAVRQWWGDLYQPLLEAGLDGFWNDMNEPALITTRPGTTAPDSVLHDFEGQGADHAQMHNIYGMQMVRASAEGLLRLRPDLRPVLLSRSGWAGLQRYAMHWTADNQSTWDHLRLSVQMILNLGISGIALDGADVGGFTGGPPPELFARWMQVGAFLPFYRVHCMQGAPDQEPWAFGPQVEQISRQSLEWRYRLLPYLYTAVWQAVHTGMPVARALSLIYPEETGTYSLDDQFMFGDHLLIAPVMQEKATSRQVYLPAGHWFDFWEGTPYHGAQTVKVAAPLEKIPVFAAAGSVIPLWPLQQYVGEHAIERLTLRIFPPIGEPLTSILYEDNGATTRPDELSNHRILECTVHSHADLLTLQCHARQGTFAPSYSEILLELIGLPAGEVATITGAEVASVQHPEQHTTILLTALQDNFTLSLKTKSVASV